MDQRVSMIMVAAKDNLRNQHRTKFGQNEFFQGTPVLFCGARFDPETDVLFVEPLGQVSDIRRLT